MLIIKHIVVILKWCSFKSVFGVKAEFTMFTDENALSIVQRVLQIDGWIIFFYFPIFRPIVVAFQKVVFATVIYNVGVNNEKTGLIS